MSTVHHEAPASAPGATFATTGPGLARAPHRSRRGRAVLTAAGAAVALVGSAGAAAAQVAPPSTASVSAGTLQVNAGLGHANQITVFPAPAEIRVFDALRPILPVAPCTSITPNLVRCPAGLVQRISVRLGDGNDVGRNNTALRSTWGGGSGNDLLSGAFGPDEYNGGSGTDQVLYSDRIGGVTVRLDGVTNDGRAGELDNVRSDVENVTGGAGPDLLIGSSVRNVLRGLGGNDVLHGLGGNDLLLGGAGNDQVFGGADVDQVSGEAGDDRAFGDAGNDSVSGGVGNDVLFGGDGNDSVTGGDGNDVLQGDAGNDGLIGDAGFDRAIGGTGVDSCSAEVRFSCP